MRHGLHMHQKLINACGAQLMHPTVLFMPLPYRCHTCVAVSGLGT
jgi:hypothetical protein